MGHFRPTAGPCSQARGAARPGAVSSRCHRVVAWPSPTVRPMRHEEETGASTGDPRQLAGQVQRGGDSPSGWSVMEAGGTMLHSGVRGGGGAALVPDGDGGLLQNR
jgi:hypothetical protein